VAIRVRSSNDNVEIYYPPYLFDGDEPASRPGIDSAPTSITIGQNFAVELLGSPAINRVVLVKTGSATHGFNMEQRFIELTFQASGNHLTVQAPSRAADAPRAFTCCSSSTRPARRRYGRNANIGVAGAPNGAVTPNLVQPGNQTAQRNVEALLQLSATDPNDDPLILWCNGTAARPHAGQSDRADLRHADEHRLVQRRRHGE
jgi:hypothetical protein